MALTDDFEQITKKAYLENAFRVEAEIAGLKSGNISSVHDRTAAATRESYHKVFNAEAARQQAAFDDAMFIALLQNERDYHSGEMDKYRNPLIEKYGEDYIGGMAEALLPDEENLDGMTDEEKLQALADKMLDEDGNLKPEYANTPEGKYVYHWNKTNKLDAAMENTRNGVPLEPEHEKAIDNADTAAIASKRVQDHDEASARADANLDKAEDQVLNTSLDFMQSG